jgi:hypothetical protein
MAPLTYSVFESLDKFSDVEERFGRDRPWTKRKCPRCPLPARRSLPYEGKHTWVCMQCGIFEDVLLAIKKATAPTPVAVLPKSSPPVITQEKPASAPRLAQKQRKRRTKRRSVWTVSGGLPDSSRRRH